MVAWSLLLPPALSGVSLATLAVLVTPADTVTALATTVIVASAPLARFPRLQLTGLGLLEVPWLGVALTKLRAAGKLSLTTVFVAISGPALCTARVNVTFWLTGTLVGLAVLTIDKSALGVTVPPVTVVTALEWLLLAFG